MSLDKSLISIDNFSKTALDKSAMEPVLSVFNCAISLVMLLIPFLPMYLKNVRYGGLLVFTVSDGVSGKFIIPFFMSNIQLPPVEVLGICSLLETPAEEYNLYK